MRVALIAATVAAFAGLNLTGGAYAQKLPSEIEERLGVRPNSLNRESDRRRYDRALPSDVEQRLGLRPNGEGERRRYRRDPYDVEYARRPARRSYSDDSWDDYQPTVRYRPVRPQRYEYYYNHY
jgi:hypothetical protein